jgi:hypothetical protein
VGSGMAVRLGGDRSRRGGSEDDNEREFDGRS